MPSIATIRAHVEARIPGALSVYQRSEPEVFPTDIAALDQQIGGIPKSALTQICAEPLVSSGKTTLLMSLLARVTQAEQFCALVDASDSFDPASALAMNVCLSRLLWVRCGNANRLKPVEQAFKAADILVQNGGFSVIAIDLGNIEEAAIRKIPLTTWFRFARVVEKTPTALIVLMACPAAQSCAALTLNIGRSTTHWAGPEGIPHARMLSEVQFDFEIGRSRTRKPVQNANARFTARPRWA
jgi:recombination protein RecA